jgi:hypothetical protein
MIDIQTVSIVVASVSVVVAAAYYVLQIRNQRRMRQTDLILRLYLFYNSKEYQEAVAKLLAAEYKDYNDFVKKYGSIPSPSPNEVQISLQMVATFFEGAGVLLSEKLLDINLVQKLFFVELYWGKIEPLAKELRKQFGEPAFWEWFEYLYNEVRKKKLNLQPRP